MGPNTKIGVCISRRRWKGSDIEIQTHTERRVPGIVSNHWKLGEWHGRDFYLTTFGGRVALLITLIFRFLVSRT